MMQSMHSSRFVQRHLRPRARIIFIPSTLRINASRSASFWWASVCQRSESGVSSSSLMSVLISAIVRPAAWAT